MGSIPFTFLCFAAAINDRDRIFNAQTLFISVNGPDCKSRLFSDLAVILQSEISIERMRVHSVFYGNAALAFRKFSVSEDVTDVDASR